MGRQLAAARKRAKMTQLELAAAMGERYDRSMIGHVEHDRSALLLEGAVRAAEVLGVSLDYLAGLTKNPKPAPEQERPESMGMFDPIPFFESALKNDFGTLYVELWDLDAAAGGGATTEGAHRTGFGAFDRQWLEANRLDARQWVVDGLLLRPPLVAESGLDRPCLRRQDAPPLEVSDESGAVPLLLNAVAGSAQQLQACA